MITLSITEREKSLLLTALEMYREEMATASDRVGTAYLSNTFRKEASEVFQLRERIGVAQDRPPVTLNPYLPADREVLVAEARRILGNTVGNQSPVINAIKRIRELTTLPLKEAKEFVDGLR